MRILVTSASGANGNGYGAILGFGPEGEFTGSFSSDPRITDPRGLSLDPSGALVYLNSGDDRMLALDLHGNVVRDSGPIPGLDPGGAEFGPDGRYCVTMRRQRTILAMPASLDEEGKLLLPEGTVPFPRGFGFGRDGRLYLSSGVAPSGQGDNTIVVFDRSGALLTPRLVTEGAGDPHRTARPHPRRPHPPAGRLLSRRASRICPHTQEAAHGPRRRTGRPPVRPGAAG